ncbi:MAG: ABC transporter substrate-binding protein [Gammaproteobacteria bacterium 28-57-27]|nr:MAG: ABC transporter substrate-binding protein [Gammaproteobacteria bacterium 28-57-27]
MHKRIPSFALLFVSLVLSIGVAQAETLKIYGPGGPAPAVKELASAFAKEKGIEVIVTAGPTPGWLEQAKNDAHLIFSGSENMMSSFIAAFTGQIDEKTVEPLYLRPSAILVRKGNPKSIKGLRDLAKPGMKIMVTEGAGQVGMWEDAAGRSGEIDLLKGFRSNIVAFAPNSGLARKRWIEQADIDAWLIWTHWQINNRDIADMVPVEPELTIWRATDIAMTTRGRELKAAAEFIDYLKSAQGEEVFKRQGWTR